MSTTAMPTPAMSTPTTSTTSTTKMSGVVTRIKRQRDTKEETTQNKQNKKTIEDLPTTSLGEKLGNVSSKQSSQNAAFVKFFGYKDIPADSETVEKPSVESLLGDTGHSETVEKSSTGSLLGSTGNSEVSGGGLFDSIPPGSRTSRRSMFSGNSMFGGLLGGGNIQNKQVDYTTESIKNYVNKLTGIIDVVEKTKLNINLEFNVVTPSGLLGDNYLIHTETIKKIILRVEYYIKNLKDIKCVHKQYVTQKQVQRTESNHYITCLTINL